MKIRRTSTFLPALVVCIFLAVAVGGARSGDQRSGRVEAGLIGEADDRARALDVGVALAPQSSDRTAPSEARSFSPEAQRRSASVPSTVPSRGPSRATSTTTTPTTGSPTEPSTADESSGALWASVVEATGPNGLSAALVGSTTSTTEPPTVLRATTVPPTSTTFVPATTVSTTVASLSTTTNTTASTSTTTAPASAPTTTTPTTTPTTTTPTTTTPTTTTKVSRSVTTTTTTKTTAAPTASAPTASASTTQTASASTTQTTSASTTQTTSASTTQTTSVVTTQTTLTASTVGNRSVDPLDSIRNDNPLFNRYAARPADAISLETPGLLVETGSPDNGSVGDGQFRVACEYSHFGYDDPIIYPGQPGASHLHMFFGNTETDGNSTTESLLNSGGGSCNGFELNRSGYWTPALLDGRGNVVVPDRIILYYKSKYPDRVEPMPQGLKMVVGNTTAESFTANPNLYWSCGSSGVVRNVSNRIQACGTGQSLNATIAFPECWDGRLDSPDHRSHMKLIDPVLECPASHPRRLPQIAILLYFPGADSVQGWHLSSDRLGGFNAAPGGTLHADWWGAWNDDAMNLWTDGCMRAVRNCSFGQTGTSRRLAPLNGWETYRGENFLPLPSG